MSNKRCIAVAELAVNLARIAGPDCGVFRVANVASKLTSLEVEAQHHAERLCNEPMPEGADERKRASIVRRAAALLDGVGFFAGQLKSSVWVEVGGDPRGCCLKLHHPALPHNGFGNDGYAVGA